MKGRYYLYGLLGSYCWLWSSSLAELSFHWSHSHAIHSSSAVQQNVPFSFYSDLANFMHESSFQRHLYILYIYHIFKRSISQQTSYFDISTIALSEIKSNLWIEFETLDMKKVFLFEMTCQMWQKEVKNMIVIGKNDYSVQKKLYE
jgi:hypothetical protein